jgi:hypothetical protein
VLVREFQGRGRKGVLLGLARGKTRSQSQAECNRGTWRLPIESSHERGITQPDQGLVAMVVLTIGRLIVSTVPQGVANRGALYRQRELEGELKALTQASGCPRSHLKQSDPLVVLVKRDVLLGTGLGSHLGA